MILSSDVAEDNPIRPRLHSFCQITTCTFSVTAQSDQEDCLHVISGCILCLAGATTSRWHKQNKMPTCYMYLPEPGRPSSHALRYCTTYAATEKWCLPGRLHNTVYSLQFPTSALRRRLLSAYCRSPRVYCLYILSSCFSNFEYEYSIGTAANT